MQFRQTVLSTTGKQSSHPRLQDHTDQPVHRLDWLQESLWLDAPHLDPRSTGLRAIRKLCGDVGNNTRGHLQANSMLPSSAGSTKVPRRRKEQEEEHSWKGKDRLQGREDNFLNRYIDIDRYFYHQLTCLDILIFCHGPVWKKPKTKKKTTHYLSSITMYFGHRSRSVVYINYFTWHNLMSLNVC